MRGVRLSEGRKRGCRATGVGRNKGNAESREEGQVGVGGGQSCK